MVTPVVSLPVPAVVGTVLDNFETRDSRHQDVEQNQIRLILLGCCDGTFGVARLGDNLESSVFQRGGEPRSEEWNIVDNEQSSHLGSTLQPGLLRFDHPEIAIPPVVEHRLSACVCVEEDEEVVSEHLHLQYSFLDRHGPHRESLPPHDDSVSVM